jgi:flagellar FliJ protein
MFRFRLEKVLAIREADRELRRSELAEALQAERTLHGEADKLSEELDAIRATAQSAAKPGDINVSQLLDIHRYALVLRTRLVEIGASKEKLNVEIERRRDRLVGADQQVRVLEKLRDRQRQAYLQEEEKQEAKAMDEIAQTQAQHLHR